MKHCKNCMEYSCGAQGSDGISQNCGDSGTYFYRTEKEEQNMNKNVLQSKTAYWITEEDGIEGWKRIVSCTCSNCNESALERLTKDMDGEVYIIEKSKYCPHCGFKMIDLNLLEKMEKELMFADMVLGAIKNVKTPMLMYDEEKNVVKKALTEYKYKLESEVRGK